MKAITLKAAWSTGETLRDNTPGCLRDDALVPIWD